MARYVARWTAGPPIEFYARPNQERFRSVAPDCWEDPFVEPSIYLLSWGERPGLRVGEEDVSPRITEQDGAFPAKKYRQTVHAEYNNGSESTNLVYLIHSLDDYVDYEIWKKLQVTSADGVKEKFRVWLEYPYNDATDRSPADVEVDGRGFSKNTHSLTFYLGPEGSTNATGFGSTISVDQALVDYSASRQVGLQHGYNDLEVSYTTESTTGTFLMNWFNVTYDRQYRTSLDYIDFRPPEDPTSSVIDYKVGGFTTTQLAIYKVVDGVAVSRLKGFTTSIDERTGAKVTYAVSFQDEMAGDPGSRSGTRYIALTDTKKLTFPRNLGVTKDAMAVFVDKPWTSVLRDPSRAHDYVIIAHSALMDSARTLANYRESAAGGSHNVLLVDAQQVYEEFDYGYPTSAAIVNFLRYAFESWSEPPRFLAIVGDGSRRLTTREIGRDRVAVPLYNEPVKSWGSLSGDTGYSYVTGGDLISDLVVGRVPAPSQVELGLYVRKVKQFEGSPNYANTWRNTIGLFSGATDRNMSGGIFVSHCEELTRDIPARFDLKKCYPVNNEDLRQAELSVFLGGRPEAEAIFDHGSIWTYYLGHGANGVWGRIYGRIADGTDARFRLCEEPAQCGPVGRRRQHELLHRRVCGRRRVFARRADAPRSGRRNGLVRVRGDRMGRARFPPRP